MKNVYHSGLENRWSSFSIIEQMANIGAEVGRAINWKKKNNNEMSTNALYRALELIDLTAKDKKNRNSLKEILRVREALVDFIVGTNIYSTTSEQWEKYFFHFNLASAQRSCR
jgi:hypothetical protein